MENLTLTLEHPWDRVELGYSQGTHPSIAGSCYHKSAGLSKALSSLKWGVE